MESSTELENLCRTCMSTRNIMNIGSNCNGKQFMRSVYNKPSGCSDSLTIMELLHSVQPQIQIVPNDKLPKLICLGCVELLQITYEFLQMSSNADLKFRKLLKEVEVVEEGPVEYQHLEYPGEVLPFVPIKEENIEDDVCSVGATTYGIQTQEYGLTAEPPFNQPPPFEELFINKSPDEEDELDLCDNNYDDDDDDDKDGAWTSIDISKTKSSNKTFSAKPKGNKSKFDDYLPPPPAPNDNGEIPCQDCEELLENLTLWREHMLGHKSGKIRRKSGPKKSICQRFICEDCGLVFDRRRPFRKHELTHPGKSKRDRNAITKNMRRENALRRMTGQEYLGYTTSGGMWAADSPRAGRQLGPTCQSNACIRSRDRYCQSFDEEIRKNIFQKFWTFTWEEKSSFVNDNAFLMDTKRCTVKNSRKKYTFVYQLPMANEKLHVCRSMFLATLGISRAMVRRWLMSVPAKKSSSPPLSNNQESNDSCG